MHGSAAVGWLLTALCAFVAAVCLLRARGAGGMRRRAATSEALMGLGMAAMALPGGASMALPPLVLLVLFATVGVRELTLLGAVRRPAATPADVPPAVPGGQRTRHQVHHLHHLVGAAAMGYMALAMPSSHGAGPPSQDAGAFGAVSGGAAAGLPLLTGALLVYYACYVLRTGLLLLPAAPAGHPAGGAGTPGRAFAVGDLPGLAAACRVAMATGMLAMLLML